MRRIVAICCILGMVIGALPASALARASAAPLCFDPSKTDKCIEGEFQTYWLQHGGLAINGYPLTNERLEKLPDGRGGEKFYYVQWFERVRMEYHDDLNPPIVLLGQFGRAIHPADPAVAASGQGRFFGETGHNVPNDFLGYWNANGGLAQFGFPLSEVFKEKLENGQDYEVQYFERARFERHPENAAPNNILLGQFGRRLLESPWGPVLAPLGGNYFTYNDPLGRFSARLPQSWTNREDHLPEQVIFRAPELWGATLAVYEPWGADIEALKEEIDRQVVQLPQYKPISLDRVNIGSYRGYRRVFQHFNSEGMTEIIIRIDFVVGTRVFTVNAFMLPGDYNRVAPLVDGIAGSMTDAR